MKKRKFNLLLNIVSICLSIAAIAVGIYSIKTASLNIGGTIGFEAHNVKATVSAQIKGDSVASDGTVNINGTPRSEYASIGDTINITGTEATTPTLSLPKFYFSDMVDSGTPADIYLKISVINNSAFNIKVYFDAPNITGVTTTIGEGSSSYAKLGTSTTNKSTDLILKLSLNANSSGAYENLADENSFSLTMHLETYEDFYVKNITETICDPPFAEVDNDGNEQLKAIKNTKNIKTSRLCTQLGHGTTQDLNGSEFKQLEWYAFAVKGINTGKGYIYNNVFYENGTENGELSDRWYSLFRIDVNADFSIKVGDNNVSLKGHELWFIQQYTVSGGYMIADENGEVVGTVEGRLFCDENIDSGNTKNTYANSTYQSKMYKYINDNTKTSDTYLTDTGIGFDTYYNNTLSKKTRTVNETANTTIRGETDTTFTVNNNFASTFWLLSYLEIGLLYNTSLTQTNKTCYLGTTYSIGQPNGLVLDDGEGNKFTYGSGWWLRTPSSYNEGCVKIGYMISCQGDIEGADVSGASVSIMNGVRTAFQITL